VPTTESFVPLTSYVRREVRQVVPQASAVLDIHFQATAGRRDTCAVACSAGTLGIFKLTPELSPSDPLSLVHTSRIAGVGEEELILSCVWHPTVPDLLAITTSTGQVRLLRTWSTDKAELASVGVVTHLAEAWTVAISPGFPPPGGRSGHGSPPGLFTVYSGGDDSAAWYVSCALDGEARDEELALQTPYSPSRIKGHTAGVTSILPLPLRLPDGAELVVTGSYDDCIRVYAVHPQAETFGVGKARILAEENLGGGVWRLKLLGIVPEHTDKLDDTRDSWTVDLLVSCMHAGARLVKILGTADGNCRVTILATFQEHKSMNYGCDYQPTVSFGERMCVSTSFYDKLLCLWPQGGGK